MARPGIEPKTSDLRVRCPTDCATRPGTPTGNVMFATIMIANDAAADEGKMFSHIGVNLQGRSYSTKLFTMKRLKQKYVIHTGENPHTVCDKRFTQEGQ